VFPPSGALSHRRPQELLALDCEVEADRPGRAIQRRVRIVSLNPTGKIPTPEDDGIVLWESNAILFYMASKRPKAAYGIDLRARPMFCAGFFGKVRTGTPSRAACRIREGFEGLLGLGHPTRPSSHEGAELQPLSQRAKRLTEGKTGGWHRLTIARFSIGGFYPSAQRLALPKHASGDPPRYRACLTACLAGGACARDARYVVLSKRAPG